MTLWTLGGVVIALVPREKLEGAHMMSSTTVFPFDGRERWIDINDAIAFVGDFVTRVSYHRLAGAPVIIIETSRGENYLFHGETGKLLSPLSDDMALAIAVTDFVGDTPLQSAQIVNNRTFDFAGPFPVWKIRFEGADGATYYISPDDGSILARRSSLWRFYSVFKRLHMMDPRQADMNNKLVLIAGLLSIAFCLTGLGLLFIRRPWKRKMVKRARISSCL